MHIPTYVVVLLVFIAYLHLHTQSTDARNRRQDSTTVATVTTAEDGNMLKMIAIVTAVICLVVMTTIIALVVTISIYCCCRHASYRNHRGRRRRHRQGDEELGQSDSRISFGSSECCEAIIPSGEHLQCSLHAHTCSSLMVNGEHV